jgi:integrase
MGLYRRGKTYWFAVMSDGRRVWQSTGTGNKKLAEKIYAKARLGLEEGRWFEPELEVEQHTFEELVERYMDEHSIPTKSPSSTQRDVYSFKQLLKAFSGMDIKDISPRKIAEYKTLRTKKGVRPATAGKELQLLSNALNIAMREWEWLESSPFEKVKINVPDNKRERWLNRDEESLLITACPEWLREIILFATNTGMREGEILSLRWPQVDLDNRAVTLLVTKNKERRSLPINETVYQLLKRKMEVRRSSGYVFPSETGTKLNSHNLNRAFRTAREKVGLEDVRFHDLRHTAGSRMAQSGVDIYTIAKILGHKTLTMTMRYSHHNVESLRHGVDALSVAKA